MKILGIHAGRVWYKITKKTKIVKPEPVPEDEMTDCVLLFCCVEKSDEISPEATVTATVESILVRLGRLKAKRVMLFPYAHLASDLGCPGISQWILRSIQMRLAEDGIDTKRAAFGWYKEFEIKSKGPVCIILFCCNHRTDSAAGVRHVPGIPRNYMQMDMHHRLACCLSAVYPEIVAVGCICFIQQIFCQIRKRKNRRLLGGCEIKPGCNMPSGNYQQMTGRDRIEIILGKRQIVFQKNLIRIAEGTVSHKKDYSAVFLPKIRSRIAIRSS